MAKILYLEDDRRTADLVSTGLSAQSHQVEQVVDGNEALDRLKLYHYDIAILDWIVPGLSGAQVLIEYRSHGGKIPIVMLTAIHDLAHKEEVLDAGADDYVTKPFEFRELAARVRALLRRPSEMQEKVIRMGNLTVNIDQQVVTVDGAQVQMKPAEFGLLEIFVKKPGRLFSSAELLDKLFSSESEATDEAVRQRVFRLRKVLSETSATVETVLGQGYKLVVS